MSSREKLKPLIVRLCNDLSSRTFSRQELLQKLDNGEYGGYSRLGVGGNSPSQTVSRLLQELRDNEQFVYFDEKKSGHYTLQQVELLESEKRDLGNAELVTYTEKETDLEKREYIIETYSRSSRWVKEAKNRLGNDCLLGGCNNTFTKPDGTKYIEVHHIIPLHKGGEDGIWNLSVLCAHHHRMAHFATDNERKKIENYLLKEVEYRI